MNPQTYHFRYFWFTFVIHSSSVCRQVEGKQQRKKLRTKVIVVLFDANKKALANSNFARA